jgi:hypothetical protein
MITINVYDRNAKAHTPEQIELLAKSIKRFGWRSFILVDQDGVIVAGHGRWHAYQNYKNKMDLPEAYIMDDKGNIIAGGPADWALSVDNEKAFRILDNEIAAMTQTDHNLAKEELAEIEDQELAEMLPPALQDIKTETIEDFDNKNKEIDSNDMQRPSVINFAYNYTEYLNMLDLIQNATEKLGCDTKEEMLKQVLQQYE